MVPTDTMYLAWEHSSKEADELFHTGLTIGTNILFPNRRIDCMHTINQSRKVNSLIDDRFDLILERIHR